MPLRCFDGPGKIHGGRASFIAAARMVRARPARGQATTVSELFCIRRGGPRTSTLASRPFWRVVAQITMADFVLADVTATCRRARVLARGRRARGRARCGPQDSVLDGIIAGFPAAYAEKVGKTSDEMFPLRQGVPSCGPPPVAPSAEV